MRTRHYFSVFGGLCFLALIGCNSSDSDSSTAPNNASDSEEATSVYRVIDTDLSLSLQSGGADQASETSTWNTVVSLLPDQVLQDHVAEYHVFSDGQDNTLAYVTQLEAEPDKWIYAIDPADAVEPPGLGFVHTIVHEFGHIMRLERTQVTPGVPKEQCSAPFPVDEGCPVNGAYISAWFEQFWLGETYTAHQAAIGDSSGMAQQDAVFAFYDTRESEFLTAYSATDPVEDFAESFTYFVLTDQVSNPAMVKEQKVNFFYQFPAFVSVRTEIRNSTSLRTTGDQ